MSWVEIGVSRSADNNDDAAALLIVRALWLVSIILGRYIQYITMAASYGCRRGASCFSVLLQLCLLEMVGKSLLVHFLLSS